MVGLYGTVSETNGLIRSLGMVSFDTSCDPLNGALPSFLQDPATENFDEASTNEEFITQEKDGLSAGAIVGIVAATGTLSTLTLSFILLGTCAATAFILLLIVMLALCLYHMKKTTFVKQTDSLDKVIPIGSDTQI